MDKDYIQKALMDYVTMYNTNSSLNLDEFSKKISVKQSRDDMYDMYYNDSNSMYFPERQPFSSAGNLTETISIPQVKRIKVDPSSGRTTNEYLKLVRKISNLVSLAEHPLSNFPITLNTEAYNIIMNDDIVDMLLLEAPENVKHYFKSYDIHMQSHNLIREVGRNSWCTPQYSNATIVGFNTKPLIEKYVDFYDNSKYNSLHSQEIALRDSSIRASSTQIDSNLNIMVVDDYIYFIQTLNIHIRKDSRTPITDSYFQNYGLFLSHLLKSYLLWLYQNNTHSTRSQHFSDRDILDRLIKLTDISVDIRANINEPEKSYLCLSNRPTSNIFKFHL